MPRSFAPSKEIDDRFPEGPPFLKPVNRSAFGWHPESETAARRNDDPVIGILKEALVLFLGDRKLALFLFVKGMDDKPIESGDNEDERDAEPVTDPLGDSKSPQV